MSYIVAATKNAHKVEEYRELLKDQNVEIKIPARLPRIYRSGGVRFKLFRKMQR